MGKPKALTCCVCGADAGQFEQHWNRDDGYGICPKCVAEQSAKITPEQMASYYGKVGVNYDQPTVRYMGRRFRVLATTKDRDEANAFIARTPGASVLCIFEDTTIVIADEKDQGEPINMESIKLMKKAHWAWWYTGPKGIKEGHVEAVDPRDAFSRALTSKTESGQLFGEERGISIDFLHDIPANDSVQYAKAGENFVMEVKKITCPSHSRHADDVVGCGSSHLSGPDEEGLFDCCDCGMFFNPMPQTVGGQA